MGGLAHYIEEEGIPTTQISLIREHTEKIKPPRALWVPFELGRPFGVPNKPEFQREVLIKVLSLLEYAAGPVLEEYPHEAESTGIQPVQLACPVSFDTHVETETSLEKLFRFLHTEIQTMETWHELAEQKSGRSTTGVSGLKPQEICSLFEDFVGGNEHRVMGAMKISDLLRLATEDLKAYYFEAIVAQPGQPADVESLSNWFWSSTYAAKVINEVRKACLKFEEKDMLLAGNLLLVPRNQMHRFTEK